MSDLENLRQEILELKSITLLSNKDVLTIDETVMFTGLSKQTLYDYCSKRMIPHYKSQNGRKTYFNKSDLEDWMLYTKVATESEIASSAARRSYLHN